MFEPTALVYSSIHFLLDQWLSGCFSPGLFNIHFCYPMRLIKGDLTRKS